MAGTTGYNLSHMQVAPNVASPTFKDINYSISLDATIDQSDEKFQADGMNVESTFGPREGSGSVSFGSIDPSTIATMTGDTFATAGSAGTSLRDRISFKGGTVPPSVILLGWVRNVSSKSAFKGTVIIIPNAKIAVPNVSFEQSSWSEMESDITFDPNANGDMLIWENVETEPTFTSGVMAMPAVIP